MASLFEEVQVILAEQLAVDKESIAIDSSVTDDLGADSLDAMELVVALEEHFDISVTDEEATKISNVSDIISLIEQKKQP